jgi:hypothetical protein
MAGNELGFLEALPRLVSVAVTLPDLPEPIWSVLERQRKAGVLPEE